MKSFPIVCRLLLAGGALALGCDRSVPPSEPEVFLEGAVPAPLDAHTEEFERRVYRVTEGVYAAVGFGLANSILVEGDDCAFVVDVQGSIESAREVRAEFEKITTRPIEAFIYTHNHADHVFGGPGFVDPGQEIDVYAHDTTEFYIDRMVNRIRPIVGVRSARMFGNHLPKEGPDRFVNAGIGPALEIGHGGGTLGLLRPTRTFEDELAVEICGVAVELVHAPGETNDQLFVWLPEKRVLMPGDNVYRAFPNLYTIRGTLYRDVLDWVRSIDQMRALRPEFLVPSHTQPISGEERIESILLAYRDAIQYVHDQTIRGMNRGLTPDELVAEIELPLQLREHPYLQEFYGTVPWSVRSVFTGYLGWFDGDSATLDPASPGERAAGYAALAGGPDALLAAAREAVGEGRYAWAAELASHVMRLRTDDPEPRLVKARALRALGQRSMSPNGRNYYLTQALELEGGVELPPGVAVGEELMSLVQSIPIRNFLAAMPVNLDPDKAGDADLLVGFDFTDVGEGYSLHVRNGIADLQEGFPEAADLAISLPSALWREIVVGARNPAVAFALGEVEVEGGTLEVVQFLGWFR
ncbi:MAG: alkyl sulfatase dimerization domain-containing protein [Myxococcota bacterium]|nr:alkyl sulfatase dimerization domain-containing protein [Myxococcota bacterium]MDP7075626.1 alkyl sulfatase dimerization domain-containing protein [Myxococcota bacterium]MDP7300592.1 alkyl sulfatase dimerization domain-containing protein [Myxococcota bacterium]MDP7432796.1 alkyl sulfatase dimerization domain-containing protein [Myxococcota bacterium]HJO22730.1 alkyl sulfatase dimerization domain-containing protein [Myxococcota bacterium]